MRRGPCEFGEEAAAENQKKKQKKNPVDWTHGWPVRRLFLICHSRVRSRHQSPGGGDWWRYSEVTQRPGGEGEGEMGAGDEMTYKQKSKRGRGVCEARKFDGGSVGIFVCSVYSTQS